MKISVLMSVYFKEKSNQLEACFNSLLLQTFKPSEVFLVKDGPLTDELEQVISVYKTLFGNSGIELNTYVNEKNIGLAKSLKKGLELVKYDIVARMDTDDICHLDRFKKQIALMKKGFDFIYGSSSEFQKLENDLNRGNIAVSPVKVRNYLNYRNPIVHPSMMFSKQKIQQLGSYRDFRFFEDYDLNIRVFNSDLKIGFIQEAIIHVRLNESYGNRRQGFEYFKLGLKHKIIWFKEGRLNRIKLIFSVFPFFIFTMLPGNFKTAVYAMLRK